MQDYLYLFRGAIAAGHTPQQMQQLMERWGAWWGTLGATGALKGGAPLSNSGKIVKSAKGPITDGPFAEAKDVVGGYGLVSARDIDAAAELAKGCPIYEMGGYVEVREITAM